MIDSLHPHDRPFHPFVSPTVDHTSWAIASDIPKDRQALAKATKDLMALDQSYYFPQDQIFPQHHSYALPPPPHSDSSSRTPTPTSAEPYPQPQIHLQTSRPRPPHHHHHPYPSAQRRTTQLHPSPLPTAPPTPLLPPQPPAPPRIKPPQSHPKPALLSPTQKKANHIQSEQKRRANIRRGYEALCDCVPALREAIRLEEEAAAAGADPSRSPSGAAFAQGKGKKPRIASRSAKDGEDKVDGRAGPRSENVVLSKTIDYITELLDERRTLLERLHLARSTLPPGHPALLHLQSQNTDEGPLWEREWKGGLGNLNPDGEGEDSS